MKKFLLVLFLSVVVACHRSGSPQPGPSPILTPPCDAAPVVPRLPRRVFPPSLRVQALPPAARQFEMLYYWDDSFYGNFRDEVSGTVNATVIFESFFQNAEALDHSFRDARSRGLTIYYSPNGDPTNGLLSAPEVAARYWSQIAALYLDEPGGDRQTVEDYLNGLMAGFQRRGLAPKPWWVNFTEAQFNGDGWRASNIAVLGFEVYMDPGLQNDPNLIAAADAKTQRLLSLIGNRAMFLVVQAYNRNGNWRNMTSLRDLQTVGYRNATSQVLSLWMFSLGRPGGTRDLPACIRREHVRMWNAANGGPTLPRLSCETNVPDPDDPPTPVPPQPPAPTPAPAPAPPAPKPPPCEAR